MPIFTEIRNKLLTRSFYLDDEGQTLEFGRRLGNAVKGLDLLPAVLFRGALGAGKTTMIRGIVSGLDGGSEAEVSSPSFNILNIYPTNPEAAHFDFYRLEGAVPDPESEDMLMDRSRLVLVEWSEYMPDWAVPEDRVVIEITLAGQGRKVEISVTEGVVQILKHLIEVYFKS